MSDRTKIPTPTPEEDLGRGGDASAGVPGGTPGEREELGRSEVRPPNSRGPGKPEPPLPPSATG